jgi:hypothetical protein
MQYQQNRIRAVLTSDTDPLLDAPYAHETFLHDALGAIDPKVSCYLLAAKGSEDQCGGGWDGDDSGDGEEDGQHCFFLPLMVVTEKMMVLLVE